VLLREFAWLQDFKVLLGHFGVERAGTEPVVNQEAARVEFEQFKFTMCGCNMSVMQGGFIDVDGTPQSLEDFMRGNPKLEIAYQELWKLMQIALVLPMTSVPCERGFSSMRFIKSKGRSLLKDSTLDTLMRISTAAQGRYALTVEAFRLKYAPRVAEAWWNAVWKRRQGSLLTTVDRKALASFIEEASNLEEEEENQSLSDMVDMLVE